MKWKQQSVGLLSAGVIALGALTGCQGQDPAEPALHQDPGGPDPQPQPAQPGPGPTGPGAQPQPQPDAEPY